MYTAPLQRLSDFEMSLSLFRNSRSAIDAAIMQPFCRYKGNAGQSLKQRCVKVVRFVRETSDSALASGQRRSRKTEPLPTEEDKDCTNREEELERRTWLFPNNVQNDSSQHNWSKPCRTPVPQKVANPYTRD